jgi:hypothetical protein
LIKTIILTHQRIFAALLGLLCGLTLLGCISIQPKRDCKDIAKSDFVQAVREGYQARIVDGYAPHRVITAKTLRHRFVTYYRPDRKEWYLWDSGWGYRKSCWTPKELGYTEQNIKVVSID